MTDEGKELIKQNSLLPASQRKTDKELAKELNVSKQTISLTKALLGCQIKNKPSICIDNVESFLKEYDEAPFGGRKEIMERYGFTSLQSLRSTVTRLRKERQK